MRSVDLAIAIRSALPLLALLAAIFCTYLPMVAPAGADEAPPKTADAPKKTTDKADKKTDRTDSIDDALLKDLDNELLEGAGDLKDRPADKRPRGERPGQQPPDGTEPDGDDSDMPSTDDDPLLTISQEMRSVEGLIPEQAKRPHAEQLQQRIIMDLSQLIEQAQKQRAQQQASQAKGGKQQTAKRQSVKQSKPSGGGTGKDSNQPAKDSTERLGKPDSARPDPEIVRGLMKDTWGNLPQRAREQMLQNSPERFLPQYELMIERYYKRLAEQQDGK
jgi:hypothetical protein